MAGIEYVNVTVPSINIWFFLFLILYLRYIPPSSSSKVQSWKEVCVCVYILSPTTIWLLFFSPWIYSSTLHTFLVFVFAPFCPFFTNYDECTMNSHTCQCFFSRVLSFSKKTRARLWWSMEGNVERLYSFPSRCVFVSKEKKIAASRNKRIFSMSCFITYNHTRNTIWYPSRFRPRLSAIMTHQEIYKRIW